MSQTGSNHSSSLAEKTWVELGRAGSNNVSIAVDRVGKSRIIGQTGSSREMNEVES